MVVALNLHRVTSLRRYIAAVGSLLSSACGGAAEVPADTAIETIDATVEVEDDTRDEPDVAEVSPEVETGPPPECGPGAIPVLFECDDGDACTEDACADGVCQHVVKADCCRSDGDCDDGVACTSDSCTPAHRCTSVRDDSFCCTKASDCEDNDACTDGVCAANQCVYPIAPDCQVASVTHCNDQNACTLDAWSAGRCDYTSLAGAGCCSVDADCVAGADVVGQCQESRCWFGRRTCARSEDCAGPGHCSTGTCEAGACNYPSACCETDRACADGWPATDDRCVDHRCVSALGEQACSSDEACVAPNACVAMTCVSGQCHAVAIAAAGCCRVDGDCAATDRCSTVACSDGQCVTNATSGPTAFASEPFATFDSWVVEADGSGAAWRLSQAQFISAPAALYFGTAAGGYDVGATHGTITSPPIELPAGYASESLRVRFWRNLAVEPISSRDTVELALVPADGAAIALWDKGFGSGPGLGWREDEVALPAGLSGSVRLRLSFDSVDAVDNTRAGVFVDDLRWLAPCP